jgi:hypothetical protein
MNNNDLKNKLSKAKNSLGKKPKDKNTNIQTGIDLANKVECRKQWLESNTNRELVKEYEQAKFNEEVHGVQMFERLVQCGRIPAGAEDEWDFMSFTSSTITENKKEQEKDKSLNNFKAPFPAFPREK